MEVSGYGNSPLSLTNKILIYKTVLKPIWTYGLAIWGCSAASILAVIHRYQAKTLRQITDAPWYVTYPTYGPTHPASTNGFPGTSRNSSHSSEITPTRPYSTNPRTAEQKAITKKMNTRCDLLR